MKRRAAVGLLVAILVAAAATMAGTEYRRHRDELRQADARLQSGIALYHQKSYAAAQSELLQALDGLENEWRAPFYLGAIQLENKNFKVAIPFLERALALNPREPKILNALGVTYYKLGRVDMAKAYFWASLDMDPGNGNTRGMMETMARLQRRQARSREHVE